VLLSSSAYYRLEFTFVCNKLSRNISCSHELTPSTREDFTSRDPYKVFQSLSLWEILFRTSLENK